MNTPSAQPSQNSYPLGTVFTIGHSTRPIEEFIGILKAWDIRLLVDIRTVPKSRHNPQFGGEALARSLEAAGIGYRAMKELGGLRHARKDSANMGWRNASFRGYADYMQTGEFRAAVEELIALTSPPPRPSPASRERGYVCIMCAEAVPWRCHRSLVADALTVRGVKVIHIMSETQANPHRMTKFARVRGEEITYPPEPGENLELFEQQ